MHTHNGRHLRLAKPCSYSCKLNGEGWGAPRAVAQATTTPTCLAFDPQHAARRAPRLVQGQTSTGTPRRQPTLCTKSSSPTPRRAHRLCTTSGPGSCRCRCMGPSSAPLRAGARRWTTAASGRRPCAATPRPPSSKKRRRHQPTCAYYSSRAPATCDALPRACPIGHLAPRARAQAHTCACG